MSKSILVMSGGVWDDIQAKGIAVFSPPAWKKHLSLVRTALKKKKVIYVEIAPKDFIEFRKMEEYLDILSIREIDMSEDIEFISDMTVNHTPFPKKSSIMWGVMTLAKPRDLK